MAAHTWAPKFQDGSELERLLRGPVAQQRAKLLIAQLAVAVGVKGGHLLREAKRGCGAGLNSSTD